MPSNNELLRKADIAVSELASNGGMLLPEQNAQFIRKLIKEPTLVRQARVVEMTSPERKINKIGFASRILRAAPSSGTALTQNQRAKPTTEQITLTTKEVIAEVRLPYDVLEDNIERATAATNDAPNTVSQGGLKDTILALMAERVALDLEELMLLSNTSFSSGDADEQAFLRLFDGWLTRATGVGGHVVDWQNAGVQKELFRDLKKALPDQYLRNLPSMRAFVSVDAETMWVDSVANRGTARGDAALTGTGGIPAYGIPVGGVALMPDSNALLTNPMNLIMGIQRSFSMEFDKDITSRVYIIVVTARVANQIEEVDATCAATNINPNL